MQRPVKKIILITEPPVFSLMTSEEENKLYQRIGEFVVSFQWIEHRLREIGWYCLDPYRRSWPPLALRSESNSELLEKVKKLFIAYLDKVAPSDAENRRTQFGNLIEECHNLRKYRNVLLHSAYIELKAGGEVIDLMRANLKIKKSDVSDEFIFDNEILTEESILGQMKIFAQTAFELNLYYTQLLHWPQVDIPIQQNSN